MMARTHELDPTRLCTAAVNTAFQTHFPEVLDVMGFNYNLKVIDAYHAKHPKQPSVGIETASTVSTRGIYSTDKLRNWVSAYDLNHTDGRSSPRSGGNFMPRANGWQADSPGPDSIIAASRRRMVGRRSIRSSALSTCADFRKTIFITTRPGGERSRCCICFRTGIGAGARGSRLRCGCIRIWIRSNYFSTARARARRKLSRSRIWNGR